MRMDDDFFLEEYRLGHYKIDHNSGKVYSLLSGSLREIRQKESKRYIRVGTNRKHIRYEIAAHRFIWITINGKIPNGFQINHINGNTRDNRLLNLEVVTATENVRHARDVLGAKFGVANPNHPLYKASQRGELNGHAKLNSSDVADIRKLYASGRYTQKELGEMYSITQVAVSQIVLGKSWKHQ